MEKEEEEFWQIFTNMNTWNDSDDKKINNFFYIFSDCVMNFFYVVAFFLGDTFAVLKIF